MDRPGDWFQDSPNVFTEGTGLDGLLMVRICEETNLWTVEWLGHDRCREDDDEALVHDFGSTPIFTRSSLSAKCLAIYCRATEPPTRTALDQNEPYKC